MELTTATNNGAMVADQNTLLCWLDAGLITRYGFIYLYCYGTGQTARTVDRAVLAEVLGIERRTLNNQLATLASRGWSDPPKTKDQLVLRSATWLPVDDLAEHPVIATSTDPNSLWFKFFPSVHHANVWRRENIH